MRHDRVFWISIIILYAEYHIDCHVINFNIDGWAWHTLYIIWVYAVRVYKLYTLTHRIIFSISLVLNFSVFNRVPSNSVVHASRCCIAQPFNHTHQGIFYLLARYFIRNTRANIRENAWWIAATNRRNSKKNEPKVTNDIDSNCFPFVFRSFASVLCVGSFCTCGSVKKKKKKKKNQYSTETDSDNNAALLVSVWFFMEFQ